MLSAGDRPAEGPGAAAHSPGATAEGQAIAATRRRPRSGSRLGTWPTAGTTIAGVIGDPVDHSLSPVLHNAALAELGLDWAYVAFPVPAGRGQAAVAAMLDLGIRGLSVTMPHKTAAAAACHRLSPVAERLGVVNTVTNMAGQLVGDSTDGPGFIDSLADQGWDVAGKRCLVLGAGGAARAVVLALAEQGAARVGVVARREDEALAVASLAGRGGAVAQVETADEAELIVNATPVGMLAKVVALVGKTGDAPGAAGSAGVLGPAEGGGAQAAGGLAVAVVHGGPRELPLGLEDKRLGPGQLVVDLIYAPPVTPLLAVARARGADTCNGLGMLIHQAARQILVWTGREASVGVMSVAALRELRKRAELGTMGQMPGPDDDDRPGGRGETA